MRMDGKWRATHQSHPPFPPLFPLPLPSSPPHTLSRISSRPQKPRTNPQAKLMIYKKRPGIITPSYNTFTRATINHFSSQCAEIASSVVYLDATVVDPGAANDGSYVSTLKEVAFWRFEIPSSTRVWIQRKEIFCAVVETGEVS